MSSPLMPQLLTLLALAGCAAGASGPEIAPTPPRPEGPEAPSLNDRGAGAEATALADEYIETLLERFPEIATQLGIPTADHGRISDNSLQAQHEWEDREDDWYARLAELDPEPLRGSPEFLTYHFLREQLESARQNRVCRAELWGVSQMFGWHTRYATLAALQPVGTPELRRAALERFGMLPDFIDTEIEKLREGMIRGYSAPRINVERVIEQLDGMLEPAPAESPFMVMAARDTAPGFREALAEVVAGGVNPALERYRDYLRDEYLAGAREDVAVAALPEGIDCYRAAVRSFTTLDLPPDEIHETGLRQMEIIHREMKEIAERSFGTSDVPALLERLHTDPDFTFDSRAEIVEYAEAAVERGRGEMDDWFGILPDADVRVEPYPEYEERSAPGASYIAPAEDGSRPGIYRINTYRPERQSRAGIESTAFHEAIPGHHLQIAIAQERMDAHPITRYLGNSGFIEGWALYAERLADEMGLFSSDLDRMGMLSNEAFRAARLVVDPGIHALGWSREEAIDYMLANTALSENQVTTEVDRYVILPGQATAYMTGSLEIMRLREMAEEQLGERFDIRDFHDRVLEDGSLTLPLLRDKIERWVEEAMANGGAGS